jgi:hypothetical protein
MSETARTYAVVSPTLIVEQWAHDLTDASHLYACLVAYCAHYDSDGAIPWAFIPADAYEAVRTLMRAGLVHRQSCPQQLVVSGYLKGHPSRRHLAKIRKEERLAQCKSRAKRSGRTQQTFGPRPRPIPHALLWAAPTASGLTGEAGELPARTRSSVRLSVRTAQALQQAGVLDLADPYDVWQLAQVYCAVYLTDGLVKVDAFTACDPAAVRFLLDRHFLTEAGPEHYRVTGYQRFNRDRAYVEERREARTRWQARCHRLSCQRLLDFDHLIFLYDPCTDPTERASLEQWDRRSRVSRRPCHIARPPPPAPVIRNCVGEIIGPAQRARIARKYQDHESWNKWSADLFARNGWRYPWDT